ncbi:hypothetical protein ACOSQ2_012863 [Xanthoceras sorbifolium]
MRKDGSTMSDYLMKKKSLIDNLAFAGYSMSNDDKLMSILSGLGSDYNPFIISVTSVPHSYSIAEITSLFKKNLTIHTKQNPLLVIMIITVMIMVRVQSAEVVRLVSLGGRKFVRVVIF